MYVDYGTKDSFLQSWCVLSLQFLLAPEARISLLPTVCAGPGLVKLELVQFNVRMFLMVTVECVHGVLLVPYLILAAGIASSPW